MPFTSTILAALTLTGSAHADFSANVFGQENRQELLDINHPWRTVGRLDSPVNTSCTATLVGRNLILTAAHCIVDPKTTKPHQGGFKFYPALTNGTAKIRANVKFFWYGTTEPTKFTGHDWAIGRLDAPLGDTFGWMGARTVSPSSLLDDGNLFLIGYAPDLKGAASAYWVNNCSFTEWIPLQNVALHNCDSSRGFSGGPLFMLDNGDKSTAYIVGINVAERREAGEVSLKGIPYSHDRANLGIPLNGITQKIIELQKNTEGL